MRVSAVLGVWRRVRDPAGAADCAHSGLEVAAGAVCSPHRDVSYFQQRRYISD